MLISTSDRAHAVVRLLVAAALALLCAPVLGQTRFGLSPEAYALYNRWVLSTCIGGEEQTLAEELKRQRPELARAFRRAIVEGPSAEEIGAVRAASEERFERRAKFPLEEFRIIGVSRQDLARFRRVSAQQYVDDQVRRFALGYRSNAVAGLGIVGGAEELRLLARIARDDRDPLSPAARAALRPTRAN